MSSGSSTSPAGAAGDLPAELRLRTAEAHARLEDGLGLLREPLSHDLFLHVLARFRGFHAVWEPAMAARNDMRVLFAGRNRLKALDDDLCSLGLTDSAVRELPRCEEAADLCRSREGALGSLYVMEGSTLGGAVIAKALDQALWSPPQGLWYFKGHGPQTSGLWRALKAQLRSEPPASAEAIIQGASRTFALLQAWAAPDARCSSGWAR